MDFKDRHEAGHLLAKALSSYKGQASVVYALPRGGVVIAYEIAKVLEAPLEVFLAHKIGHPLQPEYAIAAISEGGQLVENLSEIQQVDPKWYVAAQQNQMDEMRRRRKMYCKNRKEPSVEGKIAILVDDGVATGLTMKAAILDLQKRKPAKIVVAVPVSPQSTAQEIEAMGAEFVALEVPSDYGFRGAIGAYYRHFPQVDDSEVISIMEEAHT